MYSNPIKAGGVPEILKVLGLIGAAREKSKTNAGGNYSETIAEYEHILKYSLRLSAGVDEKIARKFEDLRTKLQAELKILYDIEREVTSISSIPVRQKTASSRNAANEADDPDIWPPPTPLGGGRNAQQNDAELRRPDTSEKNLPSWAKMRDYDESRKNAIVSRAPALQRPSRQAPAYRGANDGGESSAARAEKLRKERDARSAGVNEPMSRRRTSNSAQQPASRNAVDQAAGRKPAIPSRNAPKTR
jgi:hypothetical protein